MGGLVDDRLHFRMDDAPAESDVDRHPQPGQVVGAEARFPSLDPGEAVGVPRVVAVDDVEPAGDVPDRTGQAAEHDRLGVDLRMGPARIAPVGRLQARQPAVAGRDADRPAAVAPGGDRHESARHGRR